MFKTRLVALRMPSYDLWQNTWVAFEQEGQIVAGFEYDIKLVSQPRTWTEVIRVYNFLKHQRGWRDMSPEDLHRTTGLDPKRFLLTRSAQPLFVPQEAETSEVLIGGEMSTAAALGTGAQPEVAALTLRRTFSTLTDLAPVNTIRGWRRLLSLSEEG